MIEQLLSARRAGAPLIAVESPDLWASVRSISARINGSAPQIAWDMQNGFTPLNNASRAIGGLPDASEDPTGALAAMNQVENGVFYMLDAGDLVGDLLFARSLANLRDTAKASGVTVILLSAGFKLPTVLKRDVLVLKEPLPDDASIQQTVEDCLAAYNESLEQSDCELPPLVVDDVGAVIRACKGLSVFEAEQSVAMSIRNGALDFDALWARKIATVQQTSGLSVYHGGDRFDGLGGLEAVKEYMRLRMNGRRKPNVVVWLDEIEKSGLANTGDLSGVNSDQLGQVLTYMEDYKSFGVMLLGVPGSGKSAICKAMAAEFDRLVIRLDMGAMKGGIVGQSEQNLRDALKVITAVGDGNSLWLATSNSVDKLDAALKSRFTDTFFFDLNDDELPAIWDAQKRAFGIDDATPDVSGWSGRNVQRCCANAWDMGCTLEDASRFVISESVSGAMDLQALREQAEGRFLSASRDGVYTANKTNGRKFRLN
ncbi:AAA family ATPase [Lignipirellula cremea]|uniref:Uncharacterized AAA domain-containing protein ycf46 n=1 Tax=Lignipirellula cremea TaxID=2528010 RepID=A0A518DTK4_9BACT|nr:AAA family ATPase [Lignipirellula cremea]QDU95172.1 ATPase family associated with various cellular activities (AAA) [Lignipirellula cremea]